MGMPPDPNTWSRALTPNPHAVGAALHTPHQLQQQRLLHVLVPVDLRGDGGRQLVVEVLLYGGGHGDAVGWPRGLTARPHAPHTPQDLTRDLPQLLLRQLIGPRCVLLTLGHLHDVVGFQVGLGEETLRGQGALGTSPARWGHSWCVGDIPGAFWDIPRALGTC